MRDALPVSPSLEPAKAALRVPPPRGALSPRTATLALLAVPLAVLAAFVAQVLTRLIALVTNAAFFGKMSMATSSPADAVPHLGAWVIALPAVGGLLVGAMARYGSKAIRGHGIPEAMERILLHESRIPARLTWLKPLSAAFAIGTGGPFGTEGPIIATGGALGSLLGQVLPKMTSHERKTLLAAGAAAGMAATFGSPVSAVLLAIELLLFEYRARSLVPVAIAASVAAGVRAALVGSAAVFPMAGLAAPTGTALIGYALVGAAMGPLAIVVTRSVYAVEDAFERLGHRWRISYVWWPAIGGLVVGLVGYFAPRTLGVGYDNIETMLGGTWPARAVLMLAALKFLSWSIALGSGTSGGTLAPIFTIGSGAGAALGALLIVVAPHAGIDIRVAALVGMAALFAGSSRALLASVVFAFETTREPAGLLPLLLGCTLAYLVSALRMPHTIMTEKLARRGALVPSDYAPDPLDHVRVGEVPSLVTSANDFATALGSVVAIERSATLRHALDRLIEAGADAVEVQSDGARVQRFSLRELVTARINAAQALAR